MRMIARKRPRVNQARQANRDDTTDRDWRNADRACVLHTLSKNATQLPPSTATHSP